MARQNELRAEEPKPMVAGRPTSERVLRGREQMRKSPNKWFVWVERSQWAGNATAALCSLNGRKSVTGERHSLPFEVQTRSNDDGSVRIYARYVPGRE